jgi:hypothetical protein
MPTSPPDVIVSAGEFVVLNTIGAASSVVKFNAPVPRCFSSDVALAPVLLRITRRP